MEDQLPLLIKELSAAEFASIKAKLKNLFAEASKFDSDFSELSHICSSIPLTVLKDYQNTSLTLEEISKKNNLELRIIAQIFADKFMKEGYDYLKVMNPLRILKEFDLDRPLLFDLACLLRTVDGPTATFICSLNGLCLSVSQLILSVSLVNIYMDNADGTAHTLRIPFDSVENISQFYMLNPTLIVESMMALEEEEVQKMNFLEDMGFVTPVSDDVKEITNLARSIDNPLQSLHKFDMSIANVMKFTSTKTVDNMKNNIKDLENSRIKQIHPLATPEQLFSMVYTDVQENMEVYVAVAKNNELQYNYGKILKNLNNNSFEIKLNSAEYDSNKVIKVNRSLIAYGKECKEIDLPIGTRVIAYFKPRNRTEQKLFKNQWLPGTIGRDSSSDPNSEYLVFFDCDQEAYISRLFVRLHFDQAIDCKLDGDQYYVVLYENYTKSPTRKEFLKNTLFSNRVMHSNNIGTTIAAINDRKVYQANILDIDRDLFLLRYNKTDKNTDTEPGKGCADVRCYKHSHFDEYVYRGSSSKLNPPDERRMKRRNRFQGIPATSSSSDFRVPTARKSTAPHKVDSSSRIAAGFDDDDFDIREKKERAKKVKRTELKVPEWYKHLKRIPHDCHTPECLTQYDSIIKEINKSNLDAVVSPYFLPMLNGWTRKNFVYSAVYSNKKHTKPYVVFESPCGVNFHKLEQLGEYLHQTKSSLRVFHFNFDPNIRPEILCKEFYPDSLIDPDFALGMESVPIPVVNAVQPGCSKPKMIYNIKRYARDPTISMLLQDIAGKTVCYCECVDDCSDPSTCKCQQLTFSEHSRMDEQLQALQPLYKNGCVDYKVQSGIYECNIYCHCNQNLCNNLVVQRKVVIPLQLFLTPKSGWGVRTLVDIPKGAFISTYSGEILNNTLAEDLKRSDVYYAETDLIEDFENIKLDKGLDIPDDGIEIDMPESSGPKEGMELTKYFGDDLTFIVDAFEEGNIGRFYNHSCEPNMFVQNVFTDSHDLRLPCISFFASCDVKAGAELTWDYGYSTYDRKVKCHCGTPKCRGFLM